MYKIPYKIMGTKCELNPLTRSLNLNCTVVLCGRINSRETFWPGTDSEYHLSIVGPQNKLSDFLHQNHKNEIFDYGYITFILYWAVQTHSFSDSSLTKSGVYIQTILQWYSGYCWKCMMIKQIIYNIFYFN